METKTFENFMFVNTAGNTRNGFYHKSNLFHNDINISEAKCNYLNRTWEAYTYQSAMQQAVSNAIKKVKTEVRELLYANSAKIIELNELYKKL